MNNPLEGTVSSHKHKTYPGTRLMVTVFRDPDLQNYNVQKIRLGNRN